jgi:hypothetical protein
MAHRLRSACVTITRSVKLVCEKVSISRFKFVQKKRDDLQEAR